ncbi:LLM class flavin-dependent oxidoreductase [Brevibacillus sp. B_LB10_24]|uniref:LLM class flavin-dependent oxidoreductase n=1 Tax=Brevibacillus sp. B_LB10_24 TaxID=3380645 RepID=UPI0038BB3F1B
MTSMKLGVLDLTPIFQGVPAQTALRQAVLLAQTAEGLGYTRYWVAEHHDMPQLASSCPEVLLAHIGAQTKQIRIGSGAVLLPYYKPYKVAEAFSLLATLYPGRVDLGIGRAPGGSAHATLALSERYLEQVRQMPALLKDLTALLSGDFRVEGEFVTARPVPPIQPELWLLGTNMKSAGYAAQFGTGYVFGHFMSEQDGQAVMAAYRREFRSSALQRQPKAIAAVGVICAETTAEAERLLEEARSWSPAPVSSSSAADKPTQGRKVIVGNPEQVKQQLSDLQSRYGTDEFIVVTTIPDYDKRIRSYELLAQAVLL